MRVKIMTLRYCAVLGGFDERPLVEFVRDKEILSFREHFYRVNDVPHFTCILTYQIPAIAPEAIAQGAKQSRRTPKPAGAAGSIVWVLNRS